MVSLKRPLQETMVHIKCLRKVSCLLQPRFNKIGKERLLVLNAVSENNLFPFSWLSLEPQLDNLIGLIMTNADYFIFRVTKALDNFDVLTHIAVNANEQVPITFRRTLKDVRKFTTDQIMNVTGIANRFEERIQNLTTVATQAGGLGFTQILRSIMGITNSITKASNEKIDSQKTLLDTIVMDQNRFYRELQSQACSAGGGGGGMRPTIMLPGNPPVVSVPSTPSIDPDDDIFGGFPPLIDVGGNGGSFDGNGGGGLDLGGGGGSTGGSTPPAGGGSSSNKIILIPPGITPEQVGQFPLSAIARFICLPEDTLRTFLQPFGGSIEQAFRSFGDPEMIRQAILAAGGGCAPDTPLPIDALSEEELTSLPLSTVAAVICTTEEMLTELLAPFGGNLKDALELFGGDIASAFDALSGLGLGCPIPEATSLSPTFLPAPMPTMSATAQSLMDMIVRMTRAAGRPPPANRSAAGRRHTSLNPLTTNRASLERLTQLLAQARRSGR